MTESIKLIHSDCLDYFNNIPDQSIDMILCDLPYGTTNCKWDSIIPFDSLWNHYKRIIKKGRAIVLFGTEPFSSHLRLSNIKQYKYDWIWKKTRPSNFFAAKFMPLNDKELISVFSDGGINNGCKMPMIYYPQGIKSVNRFAKNWNTGGKLGVEQKMSLNDGRTYHQTISGYPNNLLEFNNDKNIIHPTQKPVALLEYLIKTYTVEDETVLDNCMGSGSTGVACHMSNRKFIGIEKDKKYFDLAQDRIQSIINNSCNYT